MKIKKQTINYDLMTRREKRYIKSMIKDIYLSYKDEGKNYSKEYVEELCAGDVGTWLAEMPEDD
jgi:uncharacterized protein (UPF0297 family)